MARIADGLEAASKVRAGWAVASRRLAEAGDDALIWPEFSNAADDQLRWANGRKSRKRAK